MFGGQSKGFGAMPKSVTCYICGRAYGTASISIHIKACQEKWEIEMAKRPKKERRMMPQPPPGFLEMLGKGKVSDEFLDQMNDQMHREYKDKALTPCSFCNRSFNYQAYLRHKNLCTAEKPHMPLSKSPNKMARNEDDYDDRPLKPQKNATPEQYNQFEDEINRMFSGKPGNNERPSAKAKGGLGGIQKELKETQRASSKTRKQGPSTNKFDEQPLRQKNGKQVDYGREEEINYNMLSNECAKCGRKFAMDRIDKHQSVCKVNSKPKKVKRFHKVLTEADKKKMKSAKKAAWKDQHNNLMEVISHMRKIKAAEEQGIDIRTIAPPPASVNNELVQCRGCTRRFNPEAHAKHEKSCLEKAKASAFLNNKKVVKKNETGLATKPPSAVSKPSSTFTMGQNPKKPAKDDFMEAMYAELKPAKSNGFQQKPELKTASKGERGVVFKNDPFEQIAPVQKTVRNDPFGQTGPARTSAKSGMSAPFAPSAAAKKPAFNPRY